MTAENSDDSSNVLKRRDTLLWAILSLGLGLGGGSSILTVSAVQDRYSAADAVRDFQIRDERNLSLSKDVARNIEALERLESRVRLLEIENGHRGKQL